MTSSIGQMLNVNWYEHRWGLLGAGIALVVSAVDYNIFKALNKTRELEGTIQKLKEQVSKMPQNTGGSSYELSQLKVELSALYRFHILNQLDPEIRKKLSEDSLNKMATALRETTHESKTSSCYFALAYNFPAGLKSIKLLDNTEFTRKGLYCKHLEIQPKEHAAYNNLANLLSSGETIQIPGKDGPMTQKELHLEALRLCDPNDRKSLALYYTNLAHCLAYGESIPINDTLVTKEELYNKALEFDKSHDRARLGSECCYVWKQLQEARLAKEQLLEKAKELSSQGTAYTAGSLGMGVCLARFLKTQTDWQKRSRSSLTLIGVRTISAVFNKLRRVLSKRKRQAG